MKSFKRILLTLAVLLASVVVVSCNTTKPSGENEYTYHDYAAETPDKWNPHTWETNEDSYILGYTTMGLYDFALNSSKDGYDIVPEMAASTPVDVTSQYAGDDRFGVPNSASSGYAFKIALNQNAQWETGEKINADSYIYSMQQLLNPKMQNRRADSYYQGQLILANAKAYFQQGAPFFKDIFLGLDAEENPIYYEIEDSSMFYSMSKVAAFFGKNSAQDYYEAGYESYFADADGNNLFEILKADESPYGYAQLTPDAKAMLEIIAQNFGDGNPEAYKEFCFYADGQNPTVDWSKVGLLKTGEYEITLVLANAITPFYLYYNLSSTWLVNERVYEQHRQSIGGGFEITKYGTSLATYVSFGPYKLKTFQTGKLVEMSKNDKWYGYTDGAHVGQFQTTGIRLEVTKEHATALAKFLKGELDSISLDSNDMKTYRTSQYISYTPQSYTSKLSFNTDIVKLKSRETNGVNKSILSYLDFRKAISLAVDRDDFATQCTASHEAGFTLLNYQYVADPDTGVLYRETAQGKSVLQKLYGVSDITTITGYDRAAAAVLFQSAYDQCKADGNIADTDRVEIEFAVYQNDAAYVKIVSFINDYIAEACKGTSLEGKVTIKMAVDADYYDHMKAGQLDMIISTWGGAAMNPFGVLDCYVNPTQHYEYGFDTNQELEIVIDGTPVTKSLENWHKALNEGEYAAVDIETKLDILSAVEYAILSAYCTTPIYYRKVASLNSHRVVEGGEDYIQLVGFGGIRFMTYTMDDADWAKYCKDNKYSLKY